MDSCSSQEGLCSGMGVVYSLTLLTVCFCSMQIPRQEAAQPNVEDGFVMCRCVQGRKRYLDIRLPTFVRDTQPVLGDGRSVWFNFTDNLYLFKEVSASGIHADSHTGSAAAGGRGRAPARWTRRGAPWLRAELEAKSRGDLRKLCAKLGLSLHRDGALLRTDQLLESIVDSFASQEGWIQGMGVVQSSTCIQSVFVEVGVG